MTLKEWPPKTCIVNWCFRKYIGTLKNASLPPYAVEPVEEHVEIYSKSKMI